MTRLRLAVASAALVAAGTAPLTAPAQAFACSPEVQIACAVVGIVCRAGSRVPPPLQYECNLH